MNKTDSNVVWWGKRIPVNLQMLSLAILFLLPLTPRQQNAFENMKTKLRDHFFIISHSIYRNICLNAVNFGGRVASGFCSQPRNLVQLSGLRLWGNVDYLGNMRWRGEQQVQVDRYLHRYLQYLRYKGCRYVLTDLECWRMISEKYHI